MDKAKRPGITFEKITLIELNYAWNDKFQPKDEIDYQIGIGYNSIFSDNNSLLDARLKVTIESEPLHVNVIISGIYRASDSPNVNFETFSKIHAPAQLIPFVREVIHNITARSPLPPLMLPPLNVFAMMKAIEQGEKDAPTQKYSETRASKMKKRKKST
jgi:preprotein translocase subunit SecB